MKRTSAEWQKRCHVEIIDPYGWDGKNYEFSWKTEKITRKEWARRMMFSTSHSGIPVGTCIWKDHPYIEFVYVSIFLSKIFKRGIRK